MKTIQEFQNRFPVTKTISMALRPVGKTLEHFNEDGFIEEGKNYKNQYDICRKVMDRFYVDYIDRTLRDLYLVGVREYADVIGHPKNYLADKDDKKTYQKSRQAYGKIIDQHTKVFAKQIGDAFSSRPEYSNMFKKPMLTKLAVSKAETEEEKKSLEEMSSFSTYFDAYWKNRELLFDGANKSGSVANRCLDNLDTFLNNIRCYEIVKEALGEVQLDYDAGMELEDLFRIDMACMFFTQKGIDCYNTALGGILKEDGTKLQGINEKINLYNQSIEKESGKKKLPLLNKLKKQILSVSVSRSYVPESFESDTQVIHTARALHETEIIPLMQGATDLFALLEEYDHTGVHVIQKSFNKISNLVTGKWHTVKDRWMDAYDAENLTGKKRATDAYEKRKEAAYKKMKSMPLSQMEELVPEEVFAPVFRAELKRITESIKLLYEDIRPLVEVDEYDCEKKLIANRDAKKQLNAYMDGVKEIELFLKNFMAPKEEAEKDMAFYGELNDLLDACRSFDKVYNMTRNYCTQKPYSKENFKLYFDHKEFLGGWDINQEQKAGATILIKDGAYYVAIEKRQSKAFKRLEICDEAEPHYKKIVLKSIPNANKYLSTKNINPQNPPERIKDILNRKKEDKNSLTKEDVRDFIDYCINDFLENYKKLQDADGNHYFKFNFKEPDEYESLNEFFDDVTRQAYALSFIPVKEEQINEMVEEGSIYLFRIWTRDMSEYATGIPNLYTMYLDALFAPKNAKEKVYQLNGGARIFYRPASLKLSETTIHKANEPIGTKNPPSNKKTSLFPYDIIKDRRFTSDAFELQLCIDANYMANGSYYVNDIVDEKIRSGKIRHIVGINRGERNLLWITVVDRDGKIIEQKSLNMIGGRDYRKLLAEKEEERINARKSWDALASIANIKTGYLGLAIHEICDLVLKYNAVIAMEGLDERFLQSRSGIEAQIYKKFVQMLTRKLAFLVNKRENEDNAAGLYHALQLCNLETKSKLRNGIIFFMPPGYITNIDPVTGFVNMLWPQYKNKKTAKEYFGSFERIAYDKAKKMFRFDVDYSAFPKTNASPKKEWTIWTNESRIRTFQNPEKNLSWNYEEIVLTDAFRKLFADYRIDYLDEEDLRDKIIEQDEAKFYNELYSLLKLTLQMRNSTIKDEVEFDYLLSPVMDDKGNFYDSRKFKGVDAALPNHVDANGAYNIARKMIMVMDRICEDEQPDLFVSNEDWLSKIQ